MKLVIAGGGSGGHLFPALTIAGEIISRNKDMEIIFIGRKGGLEERLVPEKGYRLEFIEMEGFKGRGLVQKAKSLTKGIAATFLALSLLREIDPQGVLGAGSYSAGPVLLAAWILHKKTAILEQNVLPGMTNRLLARFAGRIYASFEDSSHRFPERKVLVSGNPVRREILDVRENLLKANCRDRRFTVLVFGGSLGARVINRSVLDAVDSLSDISSSIRIIHQSGDRDYDEVKKRYDKKKLCCTAGSSAEGSWISLYNFIDDMAQAYSSADLVICRAGATSIAEITAIGIPAILIPYPQASDNHQEINARLLSDGGAAILLDQDQLSGQLLADTIRGFFHDRQKLADMGRAAHKLGNPEALTTIVDDYLAFLNDDGLED